MDKLKVMNKEEKRSALKKATFAVEGADQFENHE